MVERMELRDYQKRMLDEARGYMRYGDRSILLVAPTGSGKTVMFSYMLSEAQKRGKSSWIIVHRRELVNQTVAVLERFGVSPSIVAAGMDRKTSSLISVCSIQTLCRRLSIVTLPDLVVWDECHHIAASSWDSVYKCVYGSIHIGTTATPIRLDGRGLAGHFQRMVSGPGVAELISTGYLSKYRAFCPATPNLSNIRSSMGDYCKNQLNETMNRPSLTGNAIDEYEKRCNGKRAVVFCVGVKHSEDTAALFNARGIVARHIDGNTNSADRDDAIRQFSDGRVRVLCNVDICGEGVDIPGIECAILLRPTQSTGLYLQQVGRALRPASGKECAFILDHAGNCARHGLPDDEREWSLEGIDVKRRGSKQAAESVRVCEQCFAANPTRSTVCAMCGAELKATQRELEERAGELVEFERERKRIDMKRAQGQCKTYEDLVKEGHRRGYKNPNGWAYFVHNSRKWRGK